MGTTNLRNGSTGAEVTQLQDALRRLGYQVEVDGRFGPRTEDAVKSLQMLFGYTVDGIAGEGTQQLVQQQLDYGWNLSLPNAKELAMRSQSGGVAMGKPTSGSYPATGTQADGGWSKTAGIPSFPAYGGAAKEGPPTQDKHVALPQGGEKPRGANGNAKKQ